MLLSLDHVKLWHSSDRTGLIQNHLEAEGRLVLISVTIRELKVPTYFAYYCKY